MSRRCDDQTGRLSPRGTVRIPLSDDVGNVGVDDPLNVVFKAQFLFLETRNLHLIGSSFRQERLNSLVEPAMLGLERLKGRGRIIVHREAVYASPRPPKTADIIDDPRARPAER